MLNKLEEYFSLVATHQFDLNTKSNTPKIKIIERRINHFKNKMMSQKLKEFGITEELKEVVLKEVKFLSDLLKKEFKKEETYAAMADLFYIVFNLYFFSKEKEERQFFLDFAEKELYFDIYNENQLKSLKKELNPIPLSKNKKTIYLIASLHSDDDDTYLYYDKETDNVFSLGEGDDINHILSILNIDLEVIIDKSIEVKSLKEAQKVLNDIRDGIVLLGEQND